MGFVVNSQNASIPQRGDDQGNTFVVVKNGSSDPLNVSYVPPKTWSQNLFYNGDGSLAYTQESRDDGVYRQSYSYDNGKIVYISEWVKQS